MTQPAEERETLETASLRRQADIFVTFLYAASVHLVLDRSLDISAAAITTLLVVLFLLSDWLSRVALPWRLPEPQDVGPFEQLGKTALEVAGVVFLVIGLIGLVGFGGISELRLAGLTPQLAFALFLGATFVWNLLMFRIMKELKWKDLLGWSVNGKTLESKAVGTYAPRFLNWYQTQDRKYRECKANIAARDSGIDGFLKGFAGLVARAAPRLAKALASMAAQYVCLHLAIVNALGAILLIVGNAWLRGVLIGSLPVLSNSMTLPLIAIGLMAVPSSLFLAAVLIARKSALFKLLAALSEAGLLLLLLLLLSGTMIIVTIATLQVLVNVFLQWASLPEPVGGPVQAELGDMY